LALLKRIVEETQDGAVVAYRLQKLLILVKTQQHGGSSRQSSGAPHSKYFELRTSHAVALRRARLPD